MSRCKMLFLAGDLPCSSNFLLSSSIIRSCKFVFVLNIACLVTFGATHLRIAFSDNCNLRRAKAIVFVIFSLLTFISGHAFVFEVSLIRTNS